MTPSGLLVITGGSSGFGLAMATQLAAQGHKLLSLVRSTNDALPADVEQWKLDLSDPVPEQAAAKVLAYLARPDFGEQPVADVRQA